MTQQQIAPLLTLLVVGLALVVRLGRMRRARRLRLGALWVVPAVYLVVTAMVLARFPPQGAMWLWLGLALVAGIALGWRRGMMIRISVDPETRTLSQQATPTALLFILALILIRQAVRMEAGALGLDIARLTDLLMIFALGLFAASRAEMMLRARRLLAAAGDAAS